MNSLKVFVARVVVGLGPAETAAALRFVARAAWALMFLGSGFAFVVLFVPAFCGVFGGYEHSVTHIVRALLYAIVAGTLVAAQVFFTYGLACGFLWFYAAYFAKAAEKLCRARTGSSGEVDRQLP